MDKKKCNRRGLATLLSWGSKIAAALFCIFAAFFTTRSGVDIALISAGIMGPFIPIDVSKVKQAVANQDGNK